MAGCNKQKELSIDKHQADRRVHIHTTSGQQPFLTVMLCDSRVETLTRGTGWSLLNLTSS
ncbi:Hypothetical protein SMAX5B_006641 [Scophthalmus maximus]|uniref:Uncharacterized protein n=1 Tax=Scophthalmus maximus TaxID=52904 RepID=A0A2U9BIX2_SCOMX|nr:Hypothetical protein SMAX5B_006641 [Scophthalmus maximus]